MDLARAAGCKIIDLEGAGAVVDSAPDSESEDDVEVRTAAITSAIKVLVERGNPEDFVKSGPNQGKPKVGAVQAIVGFDVSAAEVAAAFEGVMADGNSG